ncbi:MAG: hypothetical protein V7L04_14165 [Nostoc sp.]
MGYARLQDSNGNISYGNPQTNGAVGIGESIRLRGGGVLSGYDAMPCYTKTQKPNGKSSSEIIEAAILFSINADHKFEDLFVYSTNINAVIYNQSINKSRQTESNSITLKDKFSVTFGHGGFVKTSFFSYGSLSANQNDFKYPITFHCPTNANIKVEVSFSPGGGVISSFCGISIDRSVSSYSIDFLEPGELLPNDTIRLIDPSRTDSSTTGTSASYETTVSPGLHFIDILGGYNYRYDNQATSADQILYTETFSGSIKITITGIAKTQLFVQQGSRINKLVELDLTKYRYNLDNTLSELRATYITFTKTQIIVHLKLLDGRGRYILHRYLLNTGLSKKTEEIYTFPEAISVLKDDWQTWASSYFPESTSLDACANYLKNSLQQDSDASNSNLINNEILSCNLYQTVNKTTGKGLLLDAIKSQNIVAKVKIKGCNRNKNTCNINREKSVTIKLKKLIVDLGVNLDTDLSKVFNAVTILAISPKTREVNK